MAQKCNNSEKLNIKSLAPAAKALCVLQILFLLSLTLCSLIPKSAIEENVQKSADYYENKYMFQQIIKDENSTVLHNYADIVYLNLAWSQNPEEPFISAVNAPYYDEAGLYKSQSLSKTVFGGAGPNSSYSRYWHGALIFIKPLLTVTDVRGIKIINAAVCILLAAALSAMLIRRRLYAPLFGYLLSLILCFCPVVPLCMEYMPTFVLMHAAGIIILACAGKLKQPSLIAFFAVLGALTCFFDFLTNEIITLFVPLIFLFCVSEGSPGEKSLSRLFKEAGCKCGAWLFGYAFTWGVKWLLCLVFLGKNSFLSALSDGAHRMAGAVPNIEQNQLLGAVVKNINRLLPFNFIKSEALVWLSAFGVLFLLFCLFFLYRKNSVPKTAYLFLAIACTPYIRYVLLSNHSCLHPFFTFRTQMITIIAVAAAFGKGLDFKAVLKRGQKNAKNNRRKAGGKTINHFNALP